MKKSYCGPRQCWWLCILLLAGLGTGCQLPAHSPPRADRELFEQTEAKAKKGDAEAQFMLGSLYTRGIGVEKNARQAAKWHHKAAEQGLARAQYQLGLDYANGDGVTLDPDAEVRWFTRAAEQGLVEAQLNLGLCYANGEGVRENPVEAVRWFRKAAEHGYAAAKGQLGQCYFEGTGVTKDLVEALKWTRQAAEQGDATAQNRLGFCYQRGEGVAKDNVEAYKWFNLAAAQDSPQAADYRVNLAKVESAMTPEQVARAQQLAREFKPCQTPAPDKAGASQSAGKVAGSRIGYVNVKVDDEDSEIFADGAFVGNPPARVKLPEGTHVIEVKKPGCKAYRREINVGGESELNLRVVLEKE